MFNQRGVSERPEFESLKFDPELSRRLVSEASQVIPLELQERLPELRSWIESLVERSKGDERPVSSFGFERLGDYYSPELLGRARVIVSDECPTLPLEALGLPDLLFADGTTTSGITFDDAYFVRGAASSDESLHFHELVHVAQSGLLGFDGFLAVYGAGLLQFGYRESPLEEMAYSLQARFEGRNPSFDVVKEVREQLSRLSIA